jgi:hypothetical protein
VGRRDVLEVAWAAVRHNDGAPGVDGVSIEQIAATPEKEAAFIEDIQRSLLERTYKAKAVLRRWWNLREEENHRRCVATTEAPRKEES